MLWFKDIVSLVNFFFHYFKLIIIKSYLTETKDKMSYPKYSLQTQTENTSVCAGYTKSDKVGKNVSLLYNTAIDRFHCHATKN